MLQQSRFWTSPPQASTPSHRAVIPMTRNDIVARIGRRILIPLHGLNLPGSSPELGHVSAASVSAAR